MTLKYILDMLARNRNEHGIELWKEMKIASLESYGIGMTRMKQLASRIKPDHKLSQELWNTDLYDARLMGILIEDKDVITRKQVESQLKACSIWPLSYAYCTQLLYKLPFAGDLAVDWFESPDPLKRRCAFLTVYQLAAKIRKLHNSFFDEFLEKMEETFCGEEKSVKNAMLMALVAIGRRNIELNAKAIAVARVIKDVKLEFNHGPWQFSDAIEALTDMKLQLRLQSG
jgi:3-methyladenine DNA glycosylase AlkD